MQRRTNPVTEEVPPLRSEGTGCPRMGAVKRSASRRELYYWARRQSRKSTVTSSDMALASSIVSRSVLESWKAKTMSWSPLESSSELQMREAASRGWRKGAVWVRELPAEHGARVWPSGESAGYA